MARRHQVGAEEPSVDTAIICMTNFDQLDENLRALSEPFTRPRSEASRRPNGLYRIRYCRMCGSCSGVCEKGVPVADMLRFLSYAEGYGQFAMARDRYLALPATSGRSDAATAAHARSTVPMESRFRTD